MDVATIYIYGAAIFMDVATTLKDAETVFKYLEPDVGAFAEVFAMD
jgi:hypothetical protein